MYHSKYEKWGVLFGVCIILYVVWGIIDSLFDPFPNFALSTKYYPVRPMGDIIYFKSREAVPIESEFWDYTLKFSNVIKKENKCFFDGVDFFSYVSPKKLKGDCFFLKINMNVIEGESIFQIGNVMVIITKETIQITKYGNVILKKILENNDEAELVFYKNGTISYIEFKIPKCNFCERVNVTYEKKTNIIVELKNNFKGTIGPWIW